MPAQTRSEPASKAGRHSFGGSARKHDLSDWLALHQLSAVQCYRLLDRACAMPQEQMTHSARHDISAERAWAMAADAMARYCPALGAFIDQTKRTTIRCVSDAPTRPVTMWDASAGVPVIRFGYRYRASDLLTVTHEFGHALQSVACRGSFVPPLAREVCAFLSEQALLDYVRMQDPAHFTKIETSWACANEFYVARSGHALRTALLDPQTPYHYDWNYPIARILASEAFDRLPQQAVQRFFENRILLSGIARFLGCERSNSPSCDAACLALTAGTFPEAETPLM